MSRIVVVGAGGIGTILAAACADAGHDVVLCSRTPRPTLELERDGQRRLVAVPVVCDPSDARPADWVLLCIKAHDTAGAAVWFDRLCTPRSTVVVCQNGIDHRERVADLVGTAAVLPALVYVAAEQVRPGLVRHRKGNHLVVPAGEVGERFAALAPTGIDIRPTKDFTTAAWRKLLTNVAANAITTLTGQRMGMFSHGAVRDLAVTVLAEAVDVGVAAGARLTDQDVKDTLAFYDTFSDDDGTSMLYDRLAGRPLEHDLFNGVIARLSARYGVPTPVNRALHTLLDELTPHAGGQSGAV